MIRMLEPFGRRPAYQRVILAIMLVIAGMFFLGVAVGVIAAMVEQGGMPRRPWTVAIPVFAAPLGAWALFAAWRLALPAAGASGFEKRYWRMWALIAALGLPLGMALALTSGDRGIADLNPLSVAPLPPATAILLATMATGLIALALVLYHRAIDDHEERAYLWGSQIGYYVLVIAVVAWWLLQRGGVVRPIDTGVAFGAILASIIVQGSVWAWFKFR